LGKVASITFSLSVTQNYRVWDVKNKSITTTRDVVFTNITPTPSERASTIKSVITPMPASKQNDVEEVERLDDDNIQDNVQQQPEEEEDEADDPLNLRSLGDGGAEAQSFVAHAHAVDPLPKSYTQARHSGEWEKWEPAMQEELAKMGKYKVWEIVPQRRHMRVVGARVKSRYRYDHNSIRVIL